MNNGMRYNFLLVASNAFPIEIVKHYTYNIPTPS